MQREDLTQEHFLRGRQETDESGQVSFLSIFPGFYPGRAPHIHIEVLDEQDRSLLVTQIAFPEQICNHVYETEHYQGNNYTSNAKDVLFRDSLEGNMADQVNGDLKAGFTLKKELIVKSKPA